MKLLLAVGLLLLSCALMAAFLQGTPFLDQDFSFGLNFGVLAVAASLMIAALAPLLLTARPIARIASATAASWLPVSLVLAGGFQLSYSGWRSIVWLIFTGLVLLTIVSSWLMALAGQFKSRTAA